MNQYPSEHIRQQFDELHTKMEKFKQNLQDITRNDVEVLIAWMKEFHRHTYRLWLHKRGLPNWMAEWLSKKMPYKDIPSLEKMYLELNDKGE